MYFANFAFIVTLVQFNRVVTPRYKQDIECTERVQRRYTIASDYLG